MSNLLKSPPPSQITDENEQLSTARMLRTLLIIVLAATIVSLVVTIAGNFGLILASALVALILFTLVGLVLLRRGMLEPARYILPISLYIGITFIVAIGYGLHDIDVIGFAGVIAIAGLTLGEDAVLVFAGLVILSLFGIGLAEMQGWLASSTRSLTNIISPVNMSIVVLAIAFIQRMIIQRLNENIQRARQNEQKQIQANKALEEERAMLETRVKERTQALERRAIQLRVASEVGSAAAGAQDLNDLLTEGARLLSARFGFYHVSIFLKDESGKYAILRAANSEGGQRMLKRGHKLEVGEVGIVGYVVQSGRARIALDVGQDAIYFDNPDLPQTRSEMALPLKAANRILGALDIQSMEPQAFKPDDIEVLQVVADQLAIAIENSRLLAESRAAVDAVRRASGEISANAWKRQLENNSLAFKSDDRGDTTATEAEPWSPEELQALREGSPIRAKNGKTLHLPILQRGQAIGIIRLVKHDPSLWSEQEVQLAQALTNQLGDSLETARLYHEATHRAERERAITEVTTRIGSAYEVDDILRSMTEELGKMFDDSDVVVQLSKEEDNHKLNEDT